MATERGAAEVKARFQEEHEFIKRYMRFLLSKLVIHSQDVLGITGILRSWGLPSPKMKLDTERESRELTLEELKKAAASLTHVAPSIEQAIREQFALLETISPGEGISDILPEAYEWISYLEQHYADALLTMDHEEIISQCLRRWERECSDSDQTLDRDLIEHAIPHAISYRVVRKIRALEHARDKLEELSLLARMARPEAEINMLRQGFILLMTAFDAAVFDLVRVKLRKDFFSLIVAFGKNEKVTLQELGDAGNFEAFRDQIIEEQLKARYIKDLLFLLEGLGVQCIDEATGDRFIQLIELVLRRNVHVHNRGVVDERYLERDQQGKPKYNLHNLALGDVARIDEPYWKLANRLCVECVTRVADWAGA